VCSNEKDSAPVKCHFVIQGCLLHWDCFLVIL
jgi:hypothetical protein